MIGVTLRIARGLALGLLLLPFAAAPAGAATDPDPDVTGIWTGKITARDFSQETDGPVATRKYLVLARLARNGPDLELEATLIDADGEESTRLLAGKIGNRAFWAFNGDPDHPILVVGRVSGKHPKLSITARGTAVHDGGFQEMKVSLKRSKTAVLGTAATGAPVAGATLTLKDRNGASVVAVTDAEGRFSLDVRGLAPPFLIKLDLPVSGTLYGVATAAGVANVTPFTDLILETWYGVQGLDLATEFATLDADTPVPSAIDVALLEALVRRTVQLWLQQSGIDPESFNLLTTPFDADGTGLDAVLDITTVAPDGSSITIDDGETSQTSSVEVSSVEGTVTVDTTTVSPGGTSVSTDGTAIPSSDAMRSAVAAALVTMESLRNKVNTRGAALTASDLQGYCTSDFLDEGRDRNWWTAEMATEFRGATLGPVTLKSIADFDAEAGTLALELDISLSIGDQSGSDVLVMNFKRSGSAWLMHGNRQIVELSVMVEYRTDYFSGYTDGPRKHINVDVRGAVDTIASVTVSGAGVFDDTPVGKSEYTEVVTAEPTPGTEIQREMDAFFAGADFEVYPAPGTPVTVTVTPVGGSPIDYVVYTEGTTTEAVALTAPTGHGFTADAHPGTPVGVEWTLPSSFAIREFQFNGFAFTDQFECQVDPDQPPEIGDTSGTITFPTTCGGETTNRANINLSFEGPNGERIQIIYDFQDP